VQLCSGCVLCCGFEHGGIQEHCAASCDSTSVQACGEVVFGGTHVCMDGCAERAACVCCRLGVCKSDVVTVQKLWLMCVQRAPVRCATVVTSRFYVGYFNRSIFVIAFHQTECRLECCSVAVVLSQPGFVCVVKALCLTGSSSGNNRTAAGMCVACKLHF
jgi:hypothetical protein